MFCAHCGSKIEEGTRFCHYCGTGGDDGSLPLIKEKQTKQHREIKKDTKPDNSIDFAEEYLAKTDIKSKEEAKKYLTQLKALFWIVFLSMFVIRGIFESESELVDILSILYIGLLIYFIIFCVKVLKAEKLPKINALWCIFFAPISWVHLYPLMADPLKIILGKKQLLISLTEAERKQTIVEANKNFWRRFLLFIGGFVGIFVLALISIYLLT